MTPRTTAYGIAGILLAGALWWLAHQWNAGQAALRELPVAQQRLKAERESTRLLMEETTRLATTDAQRRTELTGRLDGIDARLAALAVSASGLNVEYHYETIDGQKCAVALLGGDFLRVYNAAADADAATAARPSDGIDGAMWSAVPAP